MQTTLQACLKSLKSYSTRAIGGGAKVAQQNRRNTGRIEPSELALCNQQANFRHSTAKLGASLMKELLNLVLKLIFVDHTCMRLGNVSAAVNEQSHGQRGEPSVFIC